MLKVYCSSRIETLNISQLVADGKKKLKYSLFNILTLKTQENITLILKLIWAREKLNAAY